jgi:hypothetical protein
MFRPPSRLFQKRSAQLAPPHPLQTPMVPFRPTRGVVVLCRFGHNQPGRVISDLASLLPRHDLGLPCANGRDAAADDTPTSFARRLRVPHRSVAPLSPHEDKRSQIAFMFSTVHVWPVQLHALAYNLGNFMRTLALPEAVSHWSLTSLRERLVKIGARIVGHGRYVTFQMAEVAVPRGLFRRILEMINDLRYRQAVRC